MENAAKQGARNLQNMMLLPSNPVARMEDTSRETGVFLIGVVELAGGALYCTIIFLDSIKGYMGKHC